MKKCDTIRFEVFDPVEAREEWAVNFPTKDNAVRIIINDEDFCDVANKIDCERYIKETPDCDYSVEPMYGHGTVWWIYKGLADAFTEGSYSYECGLELLCCWDCGEAGCWSPVVHFRQDEKNIYWERFEQEHMGWEYDFSFCFDKNDYYKELEYLKSFL